MLYIEAELAKPRPRRIKYVPKDNPVQIDPLWLCLAAIAALITAGITDYLSTPQDNKMLMALGMPLLLTPFLYQIWALWRQRRLITQGEAVPALLNMIPKKLWWPKDFMGFTGIIYDVQAKYEYGGKTYVLDCLSKDPTKWRGRFVTVILDPKRPSNAVIYQICSYQVE